MSDKLGNNINELEDYLGNVKKLYRNKMYIENEAEEHLSVEPVTNVQELVLEESKTTRIEVASEEPETKIEKKGTVEVDLFGNVVKVKEAWEFSESLEDMNSQICNCMKCALGSTRNKFVFGVGNPNADILIIGEAPGADEDAQGRPFVGRAGKLLNDILKATGFEREEVFICNILKCRPPGNRNPLPEEVDQCKPYLDYQLNLIKPKLILLLGRVAAETLLKTKEPLAKLRGKVHDYKGYRVMVTFHPAALLRNPNWKRPTWEDMKQFKSLYEELSNK